MDAATFWQLIEDFSEPNGYCRSDNLVSNEDTFQYVIPELTRTVGTGGRSPTGEVLFTPHDGIILENLGKVEKGPWMSEEVSLPDQPFPRAARR